ncbi:hypothetical protein J3R82DRAFT_7 [Butyriboletus roseoflavus]|nr:hypothetical protein J3R82DRAFT_7 [Butyriboletus roseoflavus]
MFAKLSTLALALPLVSALTINAITGGTTGGAVTISWTASTTDPTSFSIELINSAFHNSFAIANNIQTALGSITITLPQVPIGDGYTLEAVANNNINTVYSTSGDFAIGAASTTTTSGASTTSTASSISSGSVTAPTATSASPVLSSASVASGTSSSASSTPSALNSSGAASFKLIGVAPAAALVLSAVAGAAMVF